MIEITLTILIIGAILLGVAIFINMKRERLLSINKNVNPSIIKTETLVNSKIEEALNKGLLENLEKEEQRKKLIQAEKERLLKDDYIYEKIKNAVSENKFHFVMCTNNDEITRDAINLIPGMKAFIDKFSKLTVTFPNRE